MQKGAPRQTGENLLWAPLFLRYLFPAVGDRSRAGKTLTAQSFDLLFLKTIVS